MIYCGYTKDNIHLYQVMQKFLYTKEVKMLESLMTNPYAWAFLGACTIFSVVFGIWQWYKSKRKKELSCYKNSYTIVKGGKSLLPDLELKYKNEQIQELVITKYAIWNSGNEVLQRSDIVEIKPLQVSYTAENTRILDVKILQESDETNQFVIADVDKEHARIEFDYADPKDGIVIQIMHTGESQDIMVECKIKGGKKVKILNKDKKRKYNKFVENVMVIGLGIMFFIMLFFMLLTILVSIMSMGQKFWESLISVVGSGACVLTMGVTYYKLLKDVYYINIPSGLRKTIGNDEFYK